jgi:hypothetical protein
VTTNTKDNRWDTRRRLGCQTSILFAVGQKKKGVSFFFIFFIFLFQLGVNIPKDLLKALGERPQPFLLSFISLGSCFPRYFSVNYL